MQWTGRGRQSGREPLVQGTSAFKLLFLSNNSIDEQAKRMAAYLKSPHFSQQPVSCPRRGATIKTKSMPAVGFSHKGIVLNLKALRGSEKITQPQVRTSGNCFVFFEIQLSVKGHFLKIQCIQSCVITIREEDKTGWDC